MSAARSPAPAARRAGGDKPPARRFDWSEALEPGSLAPVASPNPRGRGQWLPLGWRGVQLRCSGRLTHPQPTLRGGVGALARGRLEPAHVQPHRPRGPQRQPGRGRAHRRAGASRPERLLVSPRLAPLLRRSSCKEEVAVIRGVCAWQTRESASLDAQFHQPRGAAHVLGLWGCASHAITAV
jgi:hypothetical protein